MLSEPAVVARSVLLLPAATSDAQLLELAIREEPSLSLLPPHGPSKPNPGDITIVSWCVTVDRSRSAHLNYQTQIRMTTVQSDNTFTAAHDLAATIQHAIRQVHRCYFGSLFTYRPAMYIAKVIMTRQLSVLHGTISWHCGSRVIPRTSFRLSFSRRSMNGCSWQSFFVVSGPNSESYIYDCTLSVLK